MVMVTGAVAPSRTVEQRMAALEHGNRIRLYRAQVKRDLKAGRRSVLDELAAVDDRLASMKVFDLLLAVPKLGRVKVSRLLARNGISPSKTVGGLSERQRRVLVMALSSGGRGTVRS